MAAREVRYSESYRRIGSRTFGDKILMRGVELVRQKWSLEVVECDQAESDDESNDNSW